MKKHEKNVFLSIFIDFYQFLMIFRYTPFLGVKNSKKHPGNENMREKRVIRGVKKGCFWVIFDNYQ
jgi:hypothetical protein